MTSEIEHTSGPWHHCRANADTGGCPCGLIWAADGETVVAIAQGPENAPHNDVTPRHEVRMANCRLIASAPTLLAALEALLERYERETAGDHHRTQPWIADPEVTAARAAIAAARGQR